MLPRVKSVAYLDGYRLELRFTDKSKGVIDFRPKIVGRGGVFQPLENIEFFKRVAVDKKSGTLVWPNEVDFCPDVLYRLAMEQTPTKSLTHNKDIQPLQSETEVALAST